MDNDRTAQLEAVSIEAVQILQEMNAIVGRQAHLIEKMALIVREDHRLRDKAKTQLLDINSPPKPKGGYIHGKRHEPEPEIDTRAEMPDRTDMAEPAPKSLADVPPEPEPETKPALKGDHGRTDLPEPADASSVRASTLPEHAAMYEKPAGAPPAAKKSKRDAILDLYAETGGTYQEIATALGTTPGGVAAQIAICRNNGDSRVVDGDRKVAERRAEVPAPKSKTPPSEPEPTIRLTKKERALNHYAETGADLKDIATGIEATNGVATVYLHDARYAGDPRMARGDLIRLDKGLDPVCPAKQEEQPAVAEGPDSLKVYRANTQPKTHEPHSDDVGKVAICTLDHTTGMLDGPDDEVIIRDLKHRAVIEVMIRQNAKSESTIKSLFGRGFNGSAWDEIQRMNLALAKAGLVIHSIDGGPVYQLRKLL